MPTLVPTTLQSLSSATDAALYTSTAYAPAANTLLVAFIVTRLAASVTNPRAIKILQLKSAGYVNCVGGDIGKAVTDDGGATGNLLDYNNTTRQWYIDFTGAIAGDSVMAITTGTGAGTADGSAFVGEGVCGNGVTWNQVSGVSDASGVLRIMMYVALSYTSSTTTGLTATYAATQLGQQMSIFAFAGADVGGNDGTFSIAQVKTGTGTATSGTITLDAAAQSGALNRTISAFAHAANEVTTPRTNWTEVHDLTIATPVSAVDSQYRVSAWEAVGSATWTTSSIWAGIVAEVRANPGTITTDQTVIQAGEVTANYLVLGTFASAQALNDDIKVEGANAINGRVSANTAWSLGATTSNLDLTGTDVHVWQWLKNLTWPSTDTKANGGLGISISSDVTPTLTGVSPSDGPTNSKTWYLSGSDTEAYAGWVCYAVNPNGTPDLSIGTPAMNSVDRVGLRSKITGTVSNKTLNIQHDVIRYGTGLTFQDGTAGSTIKFSDAFALDSLNVNAWGVVTNNGGIYYLAGKMKIGSASQDAPTVFADTTQVVVWQNFPVSATLYTVLLTANGSTNTTTFQLGSYTGGLISGGCVVRGAGITGAHAIWTLDADQANTFCYLYGSALSELDSAALASTSVVRGCTFIRFADITPNGALIDDCTFQDVETVAPISGTYALILNAGSDATAITNSNFVNCNKAIRITAAGTYAFVGLTFSGNTYDVENTSGGAVTINVTGGDTPTVLNTGGGSTTTVNNNVNVTLTSKNSTGSGILGIRVRIQKVSDSTLVAEGTTNASGVFTYSYNYVSDLDVSIRARLKGYKPNSALATITSTGLSVPFTMIRDETVSLP